MPQADPELRQRMIDRFGSIMDTGPTEYLEAAGYEMTWGYTWLPKSGVLKLADMTREEFECLLFLVHEWDFGSLEIEGISHA